jgi:cytochrome c oxidase subunit II
VGRGRSGRVARLSAGLLLLMGSLTACSTQQWSDAFGFGWPDGITTQAHEVRDLWTGSIIAALVVGVLVWGLIFWASIVYRRRDSELPRQTKYNLPIEALYTVVPFIIVAVLFFYTAVTQNYVTDLKPKVDTTIEVTAFKWNWQFQYPDREDPRTQQAVYTVGTSTEIPILVIPVDQNVRFKVGSNDVIHSFWIPDTLFKRDVFPAATKNQNNEFQLRPEETGAYVGRCAELCGTYHSQMNFELRVVSRSDYDRYLSALASFGNDDLDRQSKALTAIGQAPEATTTHPFNTEREARAPSERPAGQPNG